MIKRLLISLMSFVIVAALAFLLFASLEFVEAQGNHDVAILVVDDYTMSDVAGLEGETFDAADNCTVNLEGQAYAVRGVSADPINVAHGQLVYDQIEELVQDANAGGFIDIVKVDIHGMTTEEAADEIRSAINNTNAEFYVVNMSFAVIPCEYTETFADLGSQLQNAREAKDLNRHRGLFQRAVTFYDNTVFPAMSNRAQNTSNLDPLQSLFDDLGANVIPVAAAGNFGMDFPFWPGAWGQVVSVSASTGQGYQSGKWNKQNDSPMLGLSEADQPPGQAKKERVSNYAEVMMPGEYDTGDVVIGGTSFAAPRLSVALALYVSEVGSGYCKDGGKLALNTGDWDNVTLSDAAKSCPNLDAYLP